MRAFLFILFLNLIVSVCIAQETLPKGESYFIRGEFNQPFNIGGYFGNYYNHNPKFKPGFGISGGLIHNGKRITFSPAFRASYVSGNTSVYSDVFKGFNYTKAQFNIVNLGGEMTFFARLGQNKNVNLGLGLQAGFNVYKNINGYSNNYNYGNPSYSEPLTGDNFGDSYVGFLMDLKFLPKKLIRKSCTGSFGFRAIYNAVSNDPAIMINGYTQTEAYFAFNFWSKKKAKRDSTGTIHLTDTIEEKEYKVTRYDVEIPEGVSFFIQPSFNKTINYDQADGTHTTSGTFKPSAGMALGCNFVKGRLAFSPLIKYTYVRGRAEGGDIDKYDKYQTKYFDSKFNIGILSAEFVLSRMMGPKKRFFIGVGTIVGNSVSQNISGTIVNSAWGFYKNTEQINNNYFDSFYGGGLIDLKYYLSKNVRPNCGAAIGGKWLVVNSNIPYKKTMSQVEIYLNYTFWKKRNP